MGKLIERPILEKIQRSNGEIRSVATYEITVMGEGNDVYTILTQGKQAEKDAKYLNKGNLVMAQGEIKPYEKQTDNGSVMAKGFIAQEVIYLTPTAVYTPTQQKKTPNAQFNQQDDEQL